MIHRTLRCVSAPTLVALALLTFLVLFASKGFAATVTITDTLSTTAANSYATHTITGIISTPLSQGETVTITLDPAEQAFDLANLQAPGIHGTLNGDGLFDHVVRNQSWCSAAASELYASAIDNVADTITLTVCPGDTVVGELAVRLDPVEFGAELPVRNPSTPGTYTITFATPYDAGSAQIEITPFASLTHLTVVKRVVNDNGGNNVVSDFLLYVDNGVATASVTSGQTYQLIPGTYTVAEQGAQGYEASFSGDCDALGQITLNEGDNKTCTITNNDVSASLTLVKQVVNDNGGVREPHDFVLRVDDISVPSGASRAVSANTPHTISEDPRPGYTFVSITGSAKCPAVLGGTATLDEGEHITCTITNDDVLTEPLPQCSDGVDNDADGLVDENDPGCISSDDDDESSAPLPELSSTVTIDNDVPQTELGYWSVVVQTGGESRTAYLTAKRDQSNDIYTENVLYDYYTYISTDASGAHGTRLSSHNASNPVRDQSNENIVSSSGFFVGSNGNTIDWTVTSGIAAGDTALTNRYTFTSRDGGPLGDLRLFQYLDEDIEAVSDDVFFTKGTINDNSLELVTMDGTELYGVSQSGTFQEGDDLLAGADFIGFAADKYNNIKPRIEGSGQPVSETGEIQNLPEYTHPVLGNVRGPADVVSVLAWDADEASSSATIITSLGGLPNPTEALRPPYVESPGKKVVSTGEHAIDPSKPTIVITHGLQPDNYAEVSADGNFDELFNGFSSTDEQEGMGFLIRQQLGNEVNIVQFVWPQAFQVEDVNAVLHPFEARQAAIDGYLRARRFADDAGVALAKYLFEELGASYDQPIHFIGHSLGTVANAHAARMYLDIANNVPKAQVTILDYPNRAPEEAIPDTFFATLLQPLQNKLNPSNFKIDNFYSDGPLAFGNTTQGRIYDHPNFNSPNDVGDLIFDEEEKGAAMDHTGVHQWYKWTINPNGLDNETYCGTDGTFDDPGITFSATLNPCNRGWYWSLFGEREWYAGSGNEGGWDEFPTNLGAPIVLGDGVDLELDTPSTTFGCEYDNGTIICREQSSPYMTFDDIVIPEGAEYLSFDYRFPNIGDGDYVAILLDNEPLWTLAGESVFNPGTFTNSGPIPLPEDIAEGTHKLTIALYGVGEKNAVFEMKNLQTNATHEHTARSLKESVIENLQSAKTGNKQNDQQVNNVIKAIQMSLNSKLWSDDNHLIFPQGTQVFAKEAEAVMLMRNTLRQDDMVRTNEKLPTRVKGKLLLPERVRNAFELAIDDLIAADRMLAETALEDVKAATPSPKPLAQQHREKLLAQADELMQQAESSTKPAKTVALYGKVWWLANAAMKPTGFDMSQFKMFDAYEGDE